MLGSAGCQSTKQCYREPQRRRGPNEKCLASIRKVCSGRRQQNTMTIPNPERRYQFLPYLLSCHQLICCTGTLYRPGANN
uniref:Uncharacterized protein n=1 Tax=Prolemur simus TaxID=1328070 RepID=A0A8C9A3H9_PROSS